MVERIFGPVATKVAGFVVSITPKNVMEAAKLKLDSIGNPWKMSAGDYVILRVVTLLIPVSYTHLEMIYVERKGRIEQAPVRFRDADHVMHIIEKIVSPIGRRIDEASPMVDARLPDGSRVNAVIPPISLVGPCITIRKFSREPLTTRCV